MTDSTAAPVTPEAHESIWQEFEAAWAKVKSIFGIVTSVANEAAPVVAILDPAIAPEVGLADTALNATNAAMQAGSIGAAVSNVEAAITAAKAITKPLPQPNDGGGSGPPPVHT